MPYPMCLKTWKLSVTVSDAPRASVICTVRLKSDGDGKAPVRARGTSFMPFGTDPESRLTLNGPAPPSTDPSEPQTEKQPASTEHRRAHELVAEMCLAMLTVLDSPATALVES